MSEERPVVTLQARGELMLNMQADLQVVAATTLRLEGSFARLEGRLEVELQGMREEMREMRSELRAMHRQQLRTAARIRKLEDAAAPEGTA